MATTSFSTQPCYDVRPSAPSSSDELLPSGCGDSTVGSLRWCTIGRDCVRMRAFKRSNGVLKANTLFFQLLQYLRSIHVLFLFGE